MALQELYPLFKNTKKQRLSKDFDLFSRDHAPLYQMDALKRQFSVAEHELDKAFDKATEERGQSRTPKLVCQNKSQSHEMLGDQGRTEIEQ
jgi:hypothetical protein